MGMSGWGLWHWTGEHTLDAEWDPELTENPTNQRVGSRQVWTEERTKKEMETEGEKSPWRLFLKSRGPSVAPHSPARAPPCLTIATWDQLARVKVGSENTCATQAQGLQAAGSMTSFKPFKPRQEPTQIAAMLTPWCGSLISLGVKVALLLWEPACLAEQSLEPEGTAFSAVRPAGTWQHMPPWGGWQLEGSVPLCLPDGSHRRGYKEIQISSRVKKNHWGQAGVQCAS